MFFKKLKWRPAAAMVLAISITGGACAYAVEKGVIQVFKQSPASLAKDEELWENREFKQRQMEYLDRGLVAVKTNDGVFLSWRWLGTESNTVKYNLYRDGERINAFPLNVTNFTDTGGTLESMYTVAAVVDGVEQEQCDEVTVLADNGIEINFPDIPEAVNPDGTPKLDEYGEQVEYNPNECSVSDLDGDGQYEIVLKWEPSDRQDNSIGGYTSPTILDAYELDGTRMWRINLGYNIRSGAHYTQFIVYDLDGDGKSELACKTGDGCTDKEGNVVGNPDKLWRNDEGYILDGPEYLTVFDAEKGTIIDTVEYEPGRGNVADWGDDYGNRVDRFLGCVAYLNGETPSLVMCRGYYMRMSVVAYDFVDKKLQKRWIFDSDDNNPEYMGEGNHSVAAADVDMDGFDEIIYGAATVDHDGTGLFATGFGHGDAQHTSDLVPDHPGLETFSVHEHSESRFGMEMRDARTGEVLWGSYEGDDVGRGVSDDIDPNHPGAESWAAGKMVASNGELISENPTISQNFVIYWDGDLGRELQDGNHIDKWIPEKNKTNVIFSPRGYVSFGGTKAVPGITCDMFGDWREETILFKEDRSGMAVFTTTDPTDYKIYTLMHDLQYRTYITTQNVAYNQPPHLGYYLGYDTTEIPVPRVRITYDGETYTNPDLEEGTKYYPLETLTRSEGTAMLVGSPFALVNDAMRRIDSENTEVVPYMSGGRTLVPLRFVSETLGAEVEWDEAAQKITITKDGTAVEMTIGSEIYTLNGKSRRIDAAPVISEERTFVPLRAVAEALGKKVAWDESGVIYISDEVEELESDEADILFKTISEYVEPEITDTEPIPISGEALNEKQIPVYAVEASGDDGNIAEGAVDGSFITRWNVFADEATLTLDFNEVKDVAAVAAAFYKSSERMYYFDIQVSEDGENWTTVLEDQASSGTADEETLEMFTFDEPVKARYLRYVGHGSSSNDSNNIYEIIAIAP